MVSKRNKKYLITKQERLIPHYGLRKLSVGVASVLLSTSILMGMATKAQADNQAPTETSTTQKQDQTPAKSTALDNDSQQTVQATVTPTTSINDQVGRTINVVTHDVTETTGNKATG